VEYDVGLVVRRLVGLIVGMFEDNVVKIVGCADGIDDDGVDDDRYNTIDGTILLDIIGGSKLGMNEGLIVDTCDGCRLDCNDIELGNAVGILDDGAEVDISDGIMVEDILGSK